MKMYMAKIMWVREKDGGRKNLPNARYTTVAKFGKGDAWSLILELINQSNKQKRERWQFAVISFLSPRGPKELLYDGAEFELWESKIVARGVCLYEYEGYVPK